MKKYLIRIENPDKLKELGCWRASSWKIGGLALLWLLLCSAVAICIIMLSPLRKMLPGYLPDQQRSELEQTMNRVDSLTKVYQTNEAYLKNIQSVLNTERQKKDTTVMKSLPTRTTDSLITASVRERKFVEAYTQRRRLNPNIISEPSTNYIALIPVAPGAAILGTDKTSGRHKIGIPAGRPVVAIADGVVADSGWSQNEGEACTLMLTDGEVVHYSHLSGCVAKIGQHVKAGQVLSLQKTGSGIDPGFIYLRIWRKNNPVTYSL